MRIPARTLPYPATPTGRDHGVRQALALTVSSRPGHRQVILVPSRSVIHGGAALAAGGSSGWLRRRALASSPE